MTLRKFLQAVLDSFFPPRCLACEHTLERQEDVLCSDCRLTIALPDSLFCGSCGARLPHGRKICHHDTPYILGSIAPYEHSTIKKLILKMKFGRIEKVGLFLGDLLADYIEKVIPRPEILDDSNTVVIPIPLSKERFRERGFNQAMSIAKPFAKRLQLPLEEKILIRTRHTAPQSQSENKKIRLENVSGVFEIQSGEAIRGRHVILTDDVTTTGATLRSAAETLRKHGATHILALSIAR